MSILDQFVVPTINLDFKLMTQNRNILSSLRAIVSETGATVDFAALRATIKQTENRFGVIEQAEANVPALSFNNGVAQGFLSEEAATNLLLRSEEFDNAYWTKTNLTITANDGTAPDGTTTADRVTDVSTVTNGEIDRSVTVANDSLSRVVSFYVEKLSESKFGLLFMQYQGGTATNTNIQFNYQTGEFVNHSGFSAQNQTPTGIGVEDCGKYWRIYVAASNNSSGNTTLRIRFFCFRGVSFNNATSITGSALVWGAQLETGSVATSYIKTVAATATRAKDNVTISDVAIALSSTSGSIQTTSNFPTDYPLIINGLQATVTGIKTIRFEYTTSEIKLFVDNVLADSATGTYDWSDLNEIQLGHYNGADQPNFELRDLIVRKS